MCRIGTNVTPLTSYKAGSQSYEHAYYCPWCKSLGPFLPRLQLKEMLEPTLTPPDVSQDSCHFTPWFLREPWLVLTTVNIRSTDTSITLEDEGIHSGERENMFLRLTLSHIYEGIRTVYAMIQRKKFLVHDPFLQICPAHTFRITADLFIWINFWYLDFRFRSLILFRCL